MAWTYQKTAQCTPRSTGRLMFLSLFTKLRNLIPRHRLAFMLIIVFLSALVLHFLPILLNPTGTLYGGPGDHTAGLIWLYNAYSKLPWWRFSHISAYPWGEKLWDPVFISGQLGYIYFWVLSKIAGNPVAGYNLFGLTGIAVSYVVSTAFVYRRIVRNEFIAAAAGYLIAFSPFVLGEFSVGHTSYLFGGAYVLGALWALTDIFGGRAVRRNQWLLGFILGSLVYFDPYFVLIIPVAMVVATALQMTKDVQTRALRGIPGRVWITARPLILPLLISVIIILPALLYLYFAPSQGVAGRSTINIAADAAQYGAKPSDYLLPGPYNPFLPRALTQARIDGPRGTNESFTLFPGYLFIISTLVALIMLTVLVIRRTHTMRASSPFAQFQLFCSLLVVGIYFSLPAQFQLAGLRVFTPADAITQFAYTWRIFATFDILVQPALVLTTLVASLIIYQMLPYKRTMVIIATTIFIATVVETMPRLPFSSAHTWNYGRDLPHTYKVIKEDPAIHAIAEYPLREQPYYLGSLYLTAQYYHGKPSLNADNASSPTTWYREALMDLSSPQTIPVLSSLGIDAINIFRATGAPDIAGLNLPKIDQGAYSGAFGSGSVVLYWVDRSGKNYRYMLMVHRNERPDDEMQLSKINYRLERDDIIEVVDLCKLGIALRIDCANSGDKPLAINFTTESTASKAVQYGVLKDNSLVFSGVAGSATDVTIPISSPGLFKMDIPIQSAIYISRLNVRQTPTK